MAFRTGRCSDWQLLGQAGHWHSSCRVTANHKSTRVKGCLHAHTHTHTHTLTHTHTHTHTHAHTHTHTVIVPVDAISEISFALIQAPVFNTTYIETLHKASPPSPHPSLCSFHSSPSPFIPPPCSPSGRVSVRGPPCGCTILPSPHPPHHRHQQNDVHLGNRLHCQHSRSRLPAGWSPQVQYHPRYG